MGKAAATIFVLVFLAGATYAQNRIVDLRFPVVDVEFRVEDVGGEVKALQTQETDVGLRIELASDVLFDFDKAEIHPEAREALQQVAELIGKQAKGTVRVEGHTDSIGSEEYNQKLSVQRAEAVRGWLVEEGSLTAVQFETKGFGESKPVEPNSLDNGVDNPEGRQKNRRVEIILPRG